eukprot:jgi/Mesen1/4077/ME000213S03104
MAMGPFKTIECSYEAPGVAVLTLNRSAVANAVSPEMFKELPRALAALDLQPDVRVIVLKGAGKNFCSGIDLKGLSQTLVGDSFHDCEGRLREDAYRRIKVMQDAISSIELCRKPVIAEIQGACLGAGIDIITACDIRYSTADAKFSVKEVDLAITADLGTLQRLPGIVGQGAARELALTARTFDGQEAKALGLVQKIFPSAETLALGVLEVAKSLAAKSPLAVLGTKKILNYSRDHSVYEGLDYVAVWNSATLLSADMREVLSSRSKGQPPKFSKL